MNSIGFVRNLTWTMARRLINQGRTRENREIKDFVHRMNERRMLKRIMVAKMYVTRIRGRPRARWMGLVAEDINVMGVKRWERW